MKYTRVEGLDMWLELSIQGIQTWVGKPLGETSTWKAKKAITEQHNLNPRMRIGGEWSLAWSSTK